MGTTGADFASAKAEVCRLDSYIEGVRERYEGGTEADWKDAC